jgi:hypothetical protein
MTNYARTGCLVLRHSILSACAYTSGAREGALSQARLLGQEKLTMDAASGTQPVPWKEIGPQPYQDSLNYCGGATAIAIDPAAMARCTWGPLEAAFGNRWMPPSRITSPHWQRVRSQSTRTVLRDTE